MTTYEEVLAAWNAVASLSRAVQEAPPARKSTLKMRWDYAVRKASILTDSYNLDHPEAPYGAPQAERP